MFKPVPVGDRTRYSYARINEILAMPHLIDIQRKSYEWFVQKGLMEILHDISPIKDFAGNLELSFESFELGTPKYSVEECKERDESYSAPMNVKARLIFKDKEKGEIKESSVFMGRLPADDRYRYLLLSTVLNVLSSASWCVLPAFTIV